MMVSKIYWIEKFSQGKLGTSARPRGGDWLEDEIKQWRNSGVNIVASALTDLEMAELDIITEAKVCRKYGLEFYHFPVEDRELPFSSSKWLDFIKTLNKQFQQGKSIVAHCRMGIGRSTMIAASVMILNNIPSETVFEWISEARGLLVPDTEEQKEWVKQLDFKEA